MLTCPPFLERGGLAWGKTALDTQFFLFTAACESRVFMKRRKAPSAPKGIVGASAGAGGGQKKPEPAKKRLVAASPAAAPPQPSPAGTDERRPPKRRLPRRTRFQVTHELAGHTMPVSSAKFSRDGVLVASASGDKTIKVWDARDGVFQWDMYGHAAGISDIAWSPNGAHLASASDDRTVMVWDMETRRSVCTLTGHSNFVFCVAYNPMGNVLASGSFDESIKLWDVRANAHCITTLPAHSDPVCSIDWNKDGSLLASASYDGNLRLWDSASSVCLKVCACEGREDAIAQVRFFLQTVIDDSNQAVSFVRFAPNGKFLLASTLDSTLRLWSHEGAGKALKTYTGHTNTKYCIFTCFGPDIIVSGSEDNKAYVWDVQSKELMQTLEGHDNAVIAVDHCEGRDALVTAPMGPNPVVKLWANNPEPE